MMGVYGQIQREGEVVHLVAHRLTDLSVDLASVGDRNAAFPLPHGRGDEFHHGRARRAWSGTANREAARHHIPDLHIDALKVKAREFR